MSGDLRLSQMSPDRWIIEKAIIGNKKKTNVLTNR